MKKMIFALILILVLITILGCGENSVAKLDVLSIGKADCSILRFNGACVVIDAGETDDFDEISAALNRFGITRIDLFIVSHFDKDHIGAIPEILDAFEVTNIVQSPIPGEGEVYEAYLAAAERNSINVRSIYQEETITLESAKITLFPPEKESYETDEDNNASLVARIHIGSKCFLFCGDAQTLRLQELEEYDFGTVDLMKVPHHGRYEEELITFLKQIRPGKAVICCSEKNPADSKVLQCLNDLGSQVYLTSDGDVSLSF